MVEFNPNTLTEDQLRLCYNLHRQRWRSKHKDRVSCYNSSYYRKCKGINSDDVLVDTNKLALQPII